MRSLLTLVILLLLAAPVRGQGLLDFQKEDRARRYDVYMVEVARGVAGALEAWNDAWTDHDAAALARTYGKDASLYLRNEILQGRDAIKGHFQSTLPALHALSLFPEDLRASGDLAYRIVTVRYERATGAEPPALLERRDLFIYRKKWDNDWEIEAHFAGPEAEAGGAGNGL